MEGYPGTDGGGAEPLLGGDPVLSGAALGQQFLTQLMGSVTSQQAGALNSGQLEQQAAVVIEGALTALVTDALRQMSASTEWRPVVEGISDLVKEMGAEGMGSLPGGRSVQQASHDVPPPPPPTEPPTVAPAAREPDETPPPASSQASVAPASPGTSPDAPEAPTHFHPRDAFREGRDKGQKMTMSSVAKAAAAPLAKAVNDTESEWVGIRLEDDVDSPNFGDWVVVKEGERAEGLRHVSNTTGEVYDQIVEGDPRYEGVARRVARNAAIRSTASGILGGEGVAGSLGAVAARSAGVAGIAVGTVQAGAGWLESQQQKASPYRQMYGEGTSPLAVRERFDTWKEGLKGFGTIGAEEARAQYMRASQMGLLGGERDEATGFMRDMQRRFGLSTDASAGIVENSISQGGGTAALEGFAQAITEVSRAAVAAGRTSNEAIGQFVSAQATISRMTPGAGGSTQLAAGLTEMTYQMPESLSKALGGASGLAEGVLTQQNVMAMAALNGQSPTGALFAMTDPSTAAQQGAQTIEQVGDLIFRQAANFLGRSEAQFKQELNEISGGEKISDEEQMAGIQMLVGPERAGQLLLMLNQMTGTFLGKPIAQAETINLLYEIALGSFSVTVPKGEGAESGPSDYSGSSDVRGDVRRRTGRGTAQIPGTSPDLGGSIPGADTGLGTIPGGSGVGGTISSQSSEAYRAYESMVGKSGTGDKTLEALLNPANRSKITAAGGVSSIDDVTYRIDGKEMTLAEAIREGMASRVSSGSIVNEEKPNEQPVSVRVLLGFTPDTAGVIHDYGSSADQRAGVPPRGTLSPRDVPSFGGPG